MFRCLGWGLLAALLVGCGGSAPPLPPTSKIRSALAAPRTQPEVPAETAESKVAARVAMLAEKLSEPDINNRRQACIDLGQLDAAGYPPLWKVIQGEDYDTRMMALAALSRRTVQEHAKELVPIFLKMLNDSDPSSRQLAAGRLAWFDRELGPDELLTGALAPERLKALLKSAETDKDANVRGLAQNSAMLVQQAIQGKYDKTLGEKPVSGTVRPKREIPR